MGDGLTGEGSKRRRRLGLKARLKEGYDISEGMLNGNELFLTQKCQESAPLNVDCPYTTVRVNS